MKASPATLRRPRPPTLPLSLLGLLAATCAAAAGPADQLCAPTANPCIVTRTVAFTAPTGITIDLGGRDLVVANRGEILVATGGLNLNAANITVQPGGAITVPGTGDSGGRLIIDATGSVSVQTKPDGTLPGRLDASATFQGGDIIITANGDVTLDGIVDAKSEDQDGGGGTIDILANQTLTASALAKIVARGGAKNSGGAITFTTSLGDLTVQTPLDVSGGFGGDIELDSGHDLIVGQAGTLDAHATSTSDDGGTFTLSATNSISVASKIDGRGSGNPTDGAGAGADLDIFADAGDITIAGLIDVSGPAPDGEGGFITIDAGRDLLQSGTIVASGNGPDGCGGDVELTAIGTLTAGATDVSGGSCGGGSYSAITNGPLLQRTGTAVNLDSNTGSGGEITFQGLSVSGVLNLHADGLSGGSCGLVNVHACSVDIPAGSRLSATGSGSPAITPQGNRIESNGTMTIGGALLGCAGRADGNLLRYAGAPPVTLAGATITPAALTVLLPDLLPCVPTPPTTTTTSTSSTTTTSGTLPSSSSTSTVPTTTTTTLAPMCGNGIVEAGEECDGSVGGAFCPGGFTGVVTCSPGCILDFSQCVAPTTTTTVPATTTTATTSSSTTSTSSSTTTTATSSTSTTTTPSAVCGNHVREGGEECDGSAGGALCPAPSDGVVTCAADCTLDLSQCTTTTTTQAPTTTTSTTTTSTSTGTTTTHASTSSTTTTTAASTSSTTSTTSSSTSTTRSTTTSTATTSTTSAPATSTTTTSTTTTPPTSTPPTTLPANTCLPTTVLACDDGQSCSRAAGFTALTCRFDLLDGSVAPVAPDIVGGPSIPKKLKKKITAARTLAGKAQAATGKRSVKSLKKAAGQLKVLVRLVQKTERRRKNPLPATLGDPIVDLAQRTAAQLGHLQTQTAP